MAGPAISAIITLIEYSQTIYSLFEATNAKATITLEDATRLIISTNIKLFAGTEFARIQTARDRFYREYLPSITAQSSIKQADIKEPGFLARIYGYIVSEERAVWEALQKLDWIFRCNDLHVDDYNFFARLIGQGYMLLLHMHSVTQTLRSLELLDVVDLENPKLLLETLTLLSYIDRSLDQVASMDNRVRSLRLGQISEITTTTIQNDHFTSRLYFWKDRYEKLSSTSSDQAITGNKVPYTYSDQSSFWKDPYDEVVEKRNERVRYIPGIYDALTGSDLSELMTQTKNLKPRIEQRIKKQMERGGC